MNLTRNKLPVDAVEFFQKEKLAGNMFNNDEFGDYIIYAAWPEYKVFFDGRSDMYGEKIGNEYLKVTQIKSGWEDVLKKYNVNWIIFHTKWSALECSPRKEMIGNSYIPIKSQIFL